MKVIEEKFAHIDTSRDTAPAVTFVQHHNSCYTTRFGAARNELRVRRVQPKGQEEEVQISFLIDNWKGDNERHTCEGGSMRLNAEQTQLLIRALTELA